MRVADRNRQRVRRIRARNHHTGQLQANHMIHLGFIGMAHTHHRLFHRIGRIFADRQTGLRGHQQGNAARLPEFQGGHRVLVDERMLHRCRIGGVEPQDCGQLAVQRHQPLCQIAISGVRMADAIGDMGEFRAQNVDHPPAEVAQARINPKNPHPAPFFRWQRVSTKREHPPSGFAAGVAFA